MVAKRTWSPLDRLMRNIRYNGLNMAFPSALSTGVMRTPVAKIQIPEAKGTQDFLGLNYYSVDTISFHPGKRNELFTHSEYPADADLSDTNFLANIPEAFSKRSNGLFVHTPICQFSSLKTESRITTIICVHVILRSISIRCGGQSISTGR